MPELIAERRISGRAFWGYYALSGVGVALLAATLFATGLGIFLPVAVLPTLGVFLYSKVARFANSYRLFADRLEVESGIISRQIDNLELFRVRDVALRQGLLGRVGDFGDVIVHSTDASTPAVVIRAVDAPKALYQQLRDSVSESRAQNRTMIVEEGPAFLEQP